MARIRDEDYAYATARIRAIENRLITRQRLDRLIDAPGPEEAVKLLTESGYGAGDEDLTLVGANSFENLLSAESGKTYALLENILPVPDTIGLFKRRNDYLNAKTILKAEFLGNEDAGLLAGAGTIPPHKLKRMIVDRDLADLPEVFRKAVSECADAYGRSGDPQEIDFILDKAMYDNMARDAADIGDRHIGELVTTLRDIANIRIYVRARLLNKSRDFLSQALVGDGRIPVSSYLEFSDKPVGAFFDAMRFTAMSDLASRLHESVKAGSDISGIEKILDDYFMENVRRSRYVAMGVEPVIAYLFYKEAEIRNIRLILTGKINRIPSETIRERLRAGYA